MVAPLIRECFILSVDPRCPCFKNALDIVVEGTGEDVDDPELGGIDGLVDRHFFLPIAEL